MVLRELEKIIGAQAYSALMSMLKEIGPDARTERISIVIAAILRLALAKVSPNELEQDSLASELVALEEDPFLATEEGRECEILFTLIDELCQEVGMKNHRTTVKGIAYSIAENAISQYISWYNMPWEDG